MSSGILMKTFHGRLPAPWRRARERGERPTSASIDTFLAALAPPYSIGDIVSLSTCRLNFYPSLVCWSSDVYRDHFVMILLVTSVSICCDYANRNFFCFLCRFLRQFCHVLHRRFGCKIDDNSVIYFKRFIDCPITTWCTICVQTFFATSNYIEH